MKLESVRRATLFMRLTMRAWGLKAMDAIGLDRAYEGAERAKIVYMVVESVIQHKSQMLKLRSNHLLEGAFDGNRNRYRMHAVSFSYKSICLVFLLLIFYLLLKRREKNNYDYLWACRRFLPGLSRVIDA